MRWAAEAAEGQWWLQKGNTQHPHHMKRLALFNKLVSQCSDCPYSFVTMFDGWYTLKIHNESCRFADVSRKGHGIEGYLPIGKTAIAS